MPALYLGESLSICCQHIAPERVVDELPVSLRLNQAGVFKLFHVVGERCRSDRNAFANIAAGTAILAAKFLQNLIAPGIGECP